MADSEIWRQALVGYVRNCYVQRRKDDDVEFLFRADQYGVECFLDGYAIIPMEEYERLRAAVSAEDEPQTPK